MMEWIGPAMFAALLLLFAVNLADNVLPGSGRVIRQPIFDAAIRLSDNLSGFRDPVSQPRTGDCAFFTTPPTLRTGLSCGRYQ